MGTVALAILFFCGVIGEREYRNHAHNDNRIEIYDVPFTIDIKQSHLRAKDIP